MCRGQKCLQMLFELSVADVRMYMHNYQLFLPHQKLHRLHIIPDTIIE